MPRTRFHAMMLWPAVASWNPHLANNIIVSSEGGCVHQIDAKYITRCLQAGRRREMLKITEKKKIMLKVSLIGERLGLPGWH